MNELVSILIPAYNAEKWLKETIKSALSQTWLRKEIIIVDDGSADNTYEIAKEFESKTVKVVAQRNKGASAARNKALSLSQGDYIQWLDADDLLAPDKISQQLKYNESGNNPRILLSSAFGKFYFRPQKAKFVANSLWQDLLPIEWLLVKFTDNFWMTNSAWLISRYLIEMAGPWDERLSMDDDGEYSCRIVAASQKIKFVQEAKSYYRQVNIKSVSRSTSEKACESLFLSISSSIKKLRLLEDSERTKSASLKYLQRWLYHFYPENPEIYPEKEKLLNELLNKINGIACKLGGTLSQPKVNWKYALTKKFFGRKAAMNIRNLASYSKILAFKNLDRLLSIFSSNKL